MDIKSPVAEARNEYTYSASGQKLKVIQKWNPDFSTTPVIGSTVNATSLTQTKTTDYVGNKVYENGIIKRILVDGGYIEGNTYHFYQSDHLGNNRVVANSGGIQVQKTHYYPFGSSFDYPFGSSFAVASGTSTQPYKYNGKELDMMHGLNLYDYSARYYESSIGRFTTIDPMAEKYYSISPYAYVGNNPIKRIDPTGMVYDDYFNQQGAYLGTDNDLNSNKVRIMDDATWQANKTGEKTIDHATGVANSSIHSKSGISSNASLEIYKHYNPTVYDVKHSQSERDTYLMRFEAHIVDRRVFDTKIRVNTSVMNTGGRADDLNDIKNLFLHENDHGQFLREVGPILYLQATTSEARVQPVEIRAIKAQMAHPTWEKGTPGLRADIYNYAKSLEVLIPGLNAPTLRTSITAPLKIKK